MLKNITLSAEEMLIVKARQKAVAEKRSLNDLFRDWLKKYVHTANAGGDFDKLMKRLSYVRVGGVKLTREQMNERR